DHVRMMWQLSCNAFYISFWIFFFQAEDGIRDFHVTGVQTCALPISVFRGRSRACDSGRCTVAATSPWRSYRRTSGRSKIERNLRSEERRVGKECRLWGWPAHEHRSKGAGPKGANT